MRAIQELESFIEFDLHFHFATKGKGRKSHVGTASICPGLCLKKESKWLTFRMTCNGTDGMGVPEFSGEKGTVEWFPVQSRWHRITLHHITSCTLFNLSSLEISSAWSSPEGRERDKVREIFGYWIISYLSLRRAMTGPDEKCHYVHCLFLLYLAALIIIRPPYHPRWPQFLAGRQTISFKFSCFLGIFLAFMIESANKHVASHAII